MTIDWNIQTVESLPSTQDTLKKRLNQNLNLEEGALLQALEQTKGHGRHGRHWQSQGDNLCFSFLIKPNCNINETGQIALLTALSLYQTIEKHIDKTLANIILKWPNDILLNEKKCSGILIDTQTDQSNKNIESMIIGVGINIDNAPIETAAALQQFSPSKIAPETVLNAFLQDFSNYYAHWKKHGFAELHTQWCAKTWPKGTEISVKHNKDHRIGHFETIDMLGNLIMIDKTTGQKTTISSGDVFTRV